MSPKNVDLHFCGSLFCIGEFVINVSWMSSNTQPDMKKSQWVFSPLKLRLSLHVNKSYNIWTCCWRTPTIHLWWAAVSMSWCSLPQMDSTSVPMWQKPHFVPVVFMMNSSCCNENRNLLYHIILLHIHYLYFVSVKLFKML